jgi:putative transposase
MRTMKQRRVKVHKKRRCGLRLRRYDYSRAGAYFVTLCAVDRGRLFGEIVDDQMIENPYAKIMHRCWEDLPNHYPHVT